MEITVPYVKAKFDEYNKLMFNGQLPPLPILLSNAKTFLGACTYRKRRTWTGKMECYDFKLRINTRIDLPEVEVEDTIIHEMIHYYILYNRLEDTSAHGRLFRSMMDCINARFGRHVAVSHRGSAEQREQAIDNRARFHVVAVVRFGDGRQGVKVLPRIVQRIAYYYNNVSRLPEVKSIDLYMTNDPFFNRYPNSSSLKVHYVEPHILAEHLVAAERLACDGRRVLRNQ